MTMTSAASTLGNTWNRLPSTAESLQAQPLAAGLASMPPWAPAALAADDPPRGKVLVIEDEAVVALDLQRALREAGFRTVGPATTLADIQQLIDRGAIDCAILDLDVDRRAPLPIADLLAFADVPFVFLSGAPRPMLPTPHRRRPVVEKPFSRAALVAAVEEAMAGKSAANDNRLQGLATTPPWPRVYPPL
jgi:DNA-binding NtrC family response regulator